MDIVKDKEVIVGTKKHAGGRPTKFGKELMEKAVEYIEVEFKKEEAVPTIAGLAIYLKVSRDSVYEYCKLYKKFSDIVEGLMALQERRLLTGSLLNKLNAKIAVLMLAKHGYKEESGISVESKGLNELTAAIKAIAEKKYDQPIEDNPSGNTGGEGVGEIPV